MDCDLCGKTAVCVANIEGAQLSVCAACASHGTIIKQLSQPKPAAKKRAATAQVATPEPVREELIETVRQDVSKLLRQHREKLGLNQEQFAAKLQIRASTYNHYESAAVLPDIATARKLEHVLGVPLVVHIRVGGNTAQKSAARGMTMGDFLKR